MRQGVFPIFIISVGTQENAGVLVGEGPCIFTHDQTLWFKLLKILGGISYSIITPVITKTTPTPGTDVG